MGKNVDYTVAAYPQKLPVLEQTLDFMQTSARDRASAIMLAMIGVYTANDVVILYGCLNSGSGSNYIISAGAVYYNGEIYDVPAATFTASGGQTAVGKFVTSYDACDPVKLKPSNTPVSVHKIIKLVFASFVSGTGIKDFSALKTINSTRSFLTASAGAQTCTSAAPTWQDITSITVTTPNDGKTRMYLIGYTSSSTQSGGGVAAQIEIQILQGATQVDIKTVGKLNAGSADTFNIDTAIMKPVLVPPNTVIKAQMRYTNLACTVDQQQLWAIELF